MYIAVCDDDCKEAAAIEKLLIEYQALRPGISVEASIFRTPKELLSRLSQGSHFDLFLLDIILPGMTGIELANELTKRQWNAPVIFLTVSPEFAVDAFRVRAKNYLLKPVSGPTLFSALDEITAERSMNQEEHIDIPTEYSGVAAVPISSIAYAECMKHRIFYHLTNGDMVQSKSIRVPFTESVKPLIEKPNFIQPHRSYIINLTQVRRINPGDITLLDGTVLPLSRLRQGEIKKAYIHYLSNTRKL